MAYGAADINVFGQDLLTPLTPVERRSEIWNYAIASGDRSHQLFFSTCSYDGCQLLRFKLVKIIQDTSRFAKKLDG
jgi:hypothetical protein